MGRVRDFSASGALVGTEKFYADNGSDVYVTADQISDFVGTGGTELGWVTPQQFGAIADGSSHPLSSVYGTLAAAQAAYDGAYYFVTSLTQEIDWAACKSASNAAFGPDLVPPAGDGFITPGDFLLVGAGTGLLPSSFTFLINDSEPDMVPNELVDSHTTAFVAYASSPGFVASSPVVSNTTRMVTCATTVGLSDTSMYAFGQGENGENSSLNRPIYLPQGNYIFGADTWTIRNLRSGRIMGAGKLVTTLYADDVALAFDGIWYSRLSDFALFLSDVGTCAFDLDGPVAGHSYDTRGIQGNTFENMFFYAAGAPHAVVMNRTSLDPQGSENVFLNCHFQGPCTSSLYLQNGFNALANTFIGGNFQAYEKHGIHVVNGTLSCYNTAFQSTQSALQVVNFGYDIRVEGGAGEGCVFDACRTESLQFLSSDTVRAVVRAVVQAPAIGGWFAGIVIDVGEAILAAGYLRVATVGGTTGLVEPTWSTDGSTTNNDNGVIWTPHEITFITIQQGAIDYHSIYKVYGRVYGPSSGSPTIDIDGPTEDGFSWFHDNMIVNAAAGDVTVNLPYYDNSLVGRICTIRRIDGSAHTVTVVGTFIGFNTDYDDMDTVAGRGTISYIRAHDAAGTAKWLKLSSNNHSHMVGIPRLPSYAKSALPVDTIVGRMIFVTDDVGGPIPAYSDGSDWRRVTDGAVIS